MDPKPLKIFNASAGSGKTYSLVKSYIHILLGTHESPQKFAEIIAMTFTNKAALEMKTRIIRALDELSYPEIYVEKSTRYARELADELHVDQEVVHKRARKVLNAILHRYEDFNVLTIDKFNLRLIRSFSRDLDLPIDFEVILNEHLLIEQVVDQMMSEIGKNEPLSKLIFHYAQSKLEEGERWNFRNSLIEFGKVLSSERDLPVVNQLMETDFNRAYYDELRAERSVLNASFLSHCSTVSSLFSQSGLQSSDLPGGVHTYNALQKFAEFTRFESKRDLVFKVSLLKCLEGDLPKGKQFPDDLKTAVRTFLDWYDAHQEQYVILQKFLSNFFNMALLKYVNKALQDLKHHERLIRISEFNSEISKLVADEEAPYIFERLGTRFHHFLLDEFQDTSRLQWLNMLPLLRESLAHNYSDLIVGDPKQSIYRFKNGMAEQFVALPGIYNPENDPNIEAYSNYFRQLGEVLNLENNWRSSPTIVRFNNQLFQLLRTHLPAQASDFYKSVEQHPISQLNGYVSLRCEPYKRMPKAAESLDYILTTLEACEQDGFKRGEICILGARNRSCSYWARELSLRGYKVVSADSLIVDSDASVQLILSYFALRLNPSSENLFKQFADKYCQLQEITLNEYRSYFQQRESENGRHYSFFDSEAFIRHYFRSKDVFYFRYESLYDLVQQAYLFFGFREVNNPYLHHFADMVHGFELQNGPDLSSFLEDFKTLADAAKSVQIPESDDAIRIMTIHKSKGLEFPVVIVPQLTDTIGSIKGQFFVDASGYVLHTNASGSSPIPQVQQFTEQETARRLLDLVNLYYVAFTRPIERLYVLNQYTSSTIGAFFQQVFSQFEGETTNDVFTFCTGSRARTVKTTSASEDPYFLPADTSEFLWFPNIALQDHPNLVSETALSDEQRFGTQFHLAVSTLHNGNTVQAHVDSLIHSGEVEERFRDQLTDELDQLFNSESYRKLFDGALDVLNEQSLIVGEQELLRPDKIVVKKDETLVIDYKTGLTSSKDTKQVTLYKKVLSEIGYPNVKGYLFYTQHSELVEI